MNFPGFKYQVPPKSSPSGRTSYSSLPEEESKRGTQRLVQYMDLGLIDYKECWDYQEKLFLETATLKTQNRNLPADLRLPTANYLLFCEHPHVYTLGKSGDEKNLLLNEKSLKEKNAAYYKINRGGDITYHGPGQIVGYPILDLDNFFTDIHKYLRCLEETIILTLKEYGIESGRIEGLTGVWLGAGRDLSRRDGDPKSRPTARKICALGVRTSRWVTMHGFAFNVNSDLSYFNNIIPCGISDKAVTSLSKELRKEMNMDEVKEKVKKNFARVFQCGWV